MDNTQTPQVSPQMPQMPQVVSQPGATAVEVPEEKDVAGLVKTIAIIVLSLITVTFIGLFIWMLIQYNDARTDVDGQIKDAVNEAVHEKEMEMEADFLERQKQPYSSFAGPVDYGLLSFKYPKTWSVYVDADASQGGDYKAYFNPIQVDKVSNKTLNALRLTIRNASFDSVAAEYQKSLDKKDAQLSMQIVTIGKNSDITANRYTGLIPGTEFQGHIVIFKIRDKTAILQTDSVLFEADYNQLLSTIEFNA
ncbi:MAG: hypothetical protein Q4B65_01730 [Candidatus Saccharibacteria bacterium]|nr:hypothetical protein [Candidatus Saccharibacteria bacterium]